MASWTDIDTNNLLPGQPFTSPIALALEENPRAIAEQAADAPKIADKTVAGAGVVTISGLDDFGGLWVRGQRSFENPLGVASVGSVSLEISTNSGASFLTSETIISIAITSADPGAAFMSFEGFIDFDSGSHKSILSGLATGGGASGGSGDSAYASGSITGLDSTVTDIRITGLSVLFATPQGGESAS